MFHPNPADLSARQVFLGPGARTPGRSAGPSHSEVLTMPGISQQLQDALNQAENDRDAATQADSAATASAKQAATDQQGAQDAHQKATQSYQAALAAFFSEFGVTPPAPTPQAQRQG